MPSDDSRQPDGQDAQAREAARPTDIPARGWLDVVKRTQKEIKTDNVTLIAAALWSASAGTQSLIKGLNIIYDEAESRGFVRLRGLALVLTIGAMVVALGALALIAVAPALLGEIGLQRGGELAISIGRWPALVVLIAVALAVLYRLGPDRANPRLRWLSWGAVIAILHRARSGQARDAHSSRQLSATADRR